MAVEDIVVALTLVSLGVYLALLGLAVRAARNAMNPRLQLLSSAVAAVSGLFVLGAAQSLLVQDSVLSPLPGSLRTSLLRPFMLFLAMAGVGTVVLVEAARRRSLPDLRRVRRVVIATTDIAAAAMSSGDLDATNREIDVLVAIHAGKLTDREIAEELFISPATAGAHVRSLMKKGNLSKRRSLLLVAIDDEGRA